MAAGRPRKTGKRHPNGQKSAYVNVNLETHVVRAQRARVAAQALAGRDLTGTPAGLLFVEGYLTDAELNADVQFAVLVRRYAKIMGVSLGPPRVCAYDLSGGMSQTHVYEPDEDQIAAVKARYAAVTKLLQGLGAGVVREVWACSVNQEPCSDRRLLKRGLAALTEEFTLGDWPSKGKIKRGRLCSKMAVGARPSIRVSDKAGD